MSAESSITAEELRIGKLTEDELLREYRTGIAENDDPCWALLAGELERRGIDV